MSNLFDIKMVFTQIPDLLTYLPVTLELAVVSMIVSLILGLILALIKMKKIPVLKQLANLYISVIRGTPVLVQLYARRARLFRNRERRGQPDQGQLAVFASA